MKTFQKKKEDFRCERCGVSVVGDGYTNHCPHCLYSRHVDVFPGDRKAACGGLMEPIAMGSEADCYILTHRCLACGHTKKNRTSSGDETEALVALARRLAQP